MMAVIVFNASVSTITYQSLPEDIALFLMYYVLDIYENSLRIVLFFVSVLLHKQTKCKGPINRWTRFD